MKNSRETGNRIYVNNLPFQLTPEEFEDAFKCFGPVKSRSIIFQDNGHGEAINRGIGFLTFETKEAYYKCLNSKTPVTVKGRNLVINPAKPEGEWEEKPTTTRYVGKNTKMRPFDQHGDYQENDTLYVANIPISVNDVKLRSAFMKYKPYELRIIENQNDDAQTSFAFIRIIDDQCRKDAIDQMDGIYLEGNRISVRMADELFTDD